MAVRELITATAFLAVACITPVAADERPIIIKMDVGGWIPTYEARAERWSREGKQIVIDGDCRSACTYMLWSKYNLDVCATPNARLMFHKPFWRTGPGRYDIEATPARVAWSDQRWEALRVLYPSSLADYLRSGVPNPSIIKDARVYKILRGEALFKMVKRCAFKAPVG